MTRVKFETATLADAIKKASVIAPGRGKAFDAAGGIVIDVDPETGLAVIRSTNTEIFHMEWVTTLEITGPATSWRISSQVAAPILASLPIGTGREVVLEEVQSGVSSHLAMTSGRTKAKFFLMDPTYFPQWEVFDPADLRPVSNLGGRIAMVEAFASKDEAPLSGLHFTGDMIKVTDRYRLAVVPLEIADMATGVTVPAGLLSQVLKQTGDVQVGFTESQMLIMPNETTQLRIVVYGGDYPTMAKLMDRERPESVTFKKSELLEILNRATLAAPGDRLLLLHMFIGKEAIAVKVDSHETGVLDSMEIPGQALHARIQIRLTPKYLTEVLNASPNESVTLHYDPANAERVLYLDGGSGFEVWMVTRRATE